MHLVDIIPQGAIIVGLAAKDKPQALKILSEKLGAQSGLPAEKVRAALAAREQLGSTGIGRGVAVPHVCFDELDRPYGIFARLLHPIDFDAIDNEPVDLIFAIISPNGSRTGKSESLSVLAAISRFLRDNVNALELRKAPDAHSARDVIVKHDATLSLVG